MESEREAQTRTDCSFPRVSTVNVKNSTGISLNVDRIAAKGQGALSN